MRRFRRFSLLVCPLCGATRSLKRLLSIRAPDIHLTVREAHGRKGLPEVARVDLSEADDVVRSALRVRLLESLGLGLRYGLVSLRDVLVLGFSISPRLVLQPSVTSASNVLLRPEVIVHA